MFYSVPGFLPFDQKYLGILAVLIISISNILQYFHQELVLLLTLLIRHVDVVPCALEILLSTPPSLVDEISPQPPPPQSGNEIRNGYGSFIREAQPGRISALEICRRTEKAVPHLDAEESLFLLPSTLASPQWKRRVRVLS